MLQADALKPLMAAAANVPDISAVDCSKFSAGAECPSIEEIDCLKSLDSTQLSATASGMQSIVNAAEASLTLTFNLT